MTQEMTLADHVRMRPALYIGRDGIIGLLNDLIVDCIEVCNGGKMTFTISISRNNEFTFSIKSENDLKDFIFLFTIEEQNNKYLPIILKILSEKFEIVSTGKSQVEICFSLDKNVLPKQQIDYFKLADKLLQTALLNRKIEIITIDRRQKRPNQNYFHFSQGIFYLFERAISEALGKPTATMTFDGRIDSMEFQIGIAFRTDWFPQPTIISFANDEHTICHGSLVDGILEGVMKACKKYLKEKNLTTHKVVLKNLYNGLILVCAVRGKDFKYYGNWKERLEDDNVKKHAKKITSKLVLDYLNNHVRETEQLLWRFDTTQFLNKILK